MGFQLIPTTFHSPLFPTQSYNRQMFEMWRGVDADSDVIVYPWQGYWVMASIYGYSITIAETLLLPKYNNVNGFVYFSDGKNYLHYSSKGGWVYHAYFPGYEPKEWLNSETQKWQGDIYWSGALTNYSDTAEMAFAPRGTNRNGGGSALMAKYYFPRWRKRLSGTTLSDSAGEYTAIGVDSPNIRSLGLPRWRGSNGSYFIRSLHKELSSGQYTYGDVHFDLASEKWLLGTYGALTGWYEGFEPSVKNETTFKYVNPIDPIVRPNLSLRFYDYILGDQVNEIYLGDMAIWR